MGVSLELIGTIMQLDPGVYGILETKMMGFVMDVLENGQKWSFLHQNPPFTISTAHF